MVEIKIFLEYTVVLLATLFPLTDAQRKTAFEGNPVTITCPILHRILITQTKYADTIRPGTIPQCSDPNARDRIVQLCEQKQTCTFVPDQTVFKSTCNEVTVRHRFITGYRCFKDLCLYYSTFCDNGGSCLLNTVGAPYCSCRPGYGGMNCEWGEVAVADPCSSTYCGYGKCELNSLNQPVCACTGNWTGDTCEVSPCRNETCLNGGTCVVTSDGIAKCKCNGRWQGSDCSVSPCSVNPCLNGGTCDVTDSGIAKCTCLGNWLGYYCSVTPCTNYQCQNNGTCTVSSTGRAVCQCESGFFGTFCTVNPCLPNPCSSGKTCNIIDDIGTTNCTCSGTWTGLYCSVPLAAIAGCTGSMPSTFVISSFNVKPLGCFLSSGSNPLSTLLINLRSSIVWKQLHLTLEACATQAKSSGYRYFGIEFWGECWVSNSFSPSSFTFVDQSDCDSKCPVGVASDDKQFVYEIL